MSGVAARWWDNWRAWLGPARPATSQEKIAPDPTFAPPAVSVESTDRVLGHADPGLEPKLPHMHTADLFQHTRAGAVNVVDLTLPHALDIHEFDRLNESLLALVRGEPEGAWVLDLSRLSYMGSAALGLMVNVRQQIKQSGGRLVLCGLSPQLLHIFKTCCMERLFKIVKTRQDALAAAGW